MTKTERAIRLEVAYEIISGVFSELARGSRAERDLCQEFLEPLRLLILLSDKVRKTQKTEILKSHQEEDTE